MKLKAFAKINLSIDVLRRREDNYHEVRMIMQSVSLCDVISFNKVSKGIKIYCTDPFVPCDNRNIVFKALEIIKNKFDVPYGMEISIDKRIPAAAGLAGGSSNAAAAIVAANSIWNLNLSDEQMWTIGREVGADVPFCLKGGTVLAEGIGDKLLKLPPLGDIHIVLAKPPIHVSTKETYENLKLDSITERPNIDRLITALYDGDVKYIARNMVNVLESVTKRRYPVIGEIKRTMMEEGALGSLMSGSGPTVFGLFETLDDVERCLSKLKEHFKDVYMTGPVENTPMEVIYG